MTYRFQSETTETCRNCALRGAALCRTVRDSGLPGVRPARVRRYGRDETLVEDGEVPGFLGVLRSGYLRKENLRLSGRRLLLDLACPGDVVGGLSSHELPFTLETATEAEICMFDRSTVERMMAENHRFHRQVMQAICTQHSVLLDMIWRRGALTSRERILAFLVMATEIMPTEPQPDGSVIVSIRLSRHDWADLSNTAVETISRTMRYLAEKQLVIGLPNARYWIRSVERLALLAGMDPVHERPARPAPVLEDDAASEPAEGMTDVNARHLETPTLDFVPDTTPPRYRGATGGKMRDVQEQIRH